MAQTMGQVVRNFSPEFDKQPPAGLNTAVLNGEFEFADATATTAAVAGAAGDFGVAGMNYFRAVVNAKTFVAGTTHSVFSIEVADDAAFTVNLRRVAFVTMPLVAGPWCFVLAGVCPDGAKRYARIGFEAGAGASAVFDAFLSACP